MRDFQVSGNNVLEERWEYENGGAKRLLYYGCAKAGANESVDCWLIEKYNYNNPVVSKGFPNGSPEQKFSWAKRGDYHYSSDANS